MTAIRQPTNEFRRSVEDSLRWRDFVHRPDGIYINTPPKSGTTWMHGIVSSLMWLMSAGPGDRGH